ncbi:hypothetical protein M8J75_008623 [Diaphorina citri]|nr:hypothetical protein M8J75_008623 [Diaphorina citri]
MSNPFVFDEDSAEEESMSKDCTIQVPESSSEDSESSSESSKSAGSDEYNFDPNVSTTSIKRMKKRKDLLKGRKKRREKMELEEEPNNSSLRNNPNDFDNDDEDFGVDEEPILPNHTRPAYCYRNISQDKIPPSQSYMTLDQLRVNKFQVADENNEGDQEALEHTDESLRQKREEFNKKLQAEPQNVTLWLDFVKFQDTLCSHEKLQSAGTSSSGRSLDRVYAEKKVTILDKALKMNPNNDALSNARYQIMIKHQPADKVLQDLKLLLGKARTNMYLHREYVRGVQHNMNRNNVDYLLEEFHHALQMSERKQALSTLLEFGTFLKQAGLWEILLCVIQQYLEENLNSSKNFDMGQVFELPEMSEEEEQKFLRDELSWVSNLDKTELSSWVRVETDRSSVHFSPVYCLPDDVIKFVRPVPSLEGLLSVSLALMKVPPLPLSHSAYILCFLGTADNTGDDAELLATGHFSLLSHLDTRECPCYLNASPPLLPDLISPPSYILPSLHPPHDKYLRLVLDWWRTAVGLLDDYQQIPMYVWLFRFLRSLFVSPENRTKDLYDRSKALIKNVLKQEKFRSAVPLYIEFAYFERDYGKMEEGIKVLSKLLDSTLPAANCDPTCNAEDKPSPSANLLAAARALIILMVQNKQKTEALVKYKELLGKLFSLDLTSTTTTLLSLIRSSIDRHLSSLNHSEELFLRSLYESHLPTELILTGAWFIYLSARETSGKHEPDSGVSASEENVYAYLTGYIERFEAGRSLNVSFHVKETLTEQLCVFLADSIGGAGDSLVLKLKHHLAKAAETFPNNAALCHLASVHHAGVLTRTPHVLPHAIHALTCRQIPAGAEHSELAAKVSLFVHRKWHGMTATEKSAAEKTPSAANGDSADEKTATAANGNADEKTAAADGNSCDCNILSIVDRVPSSKAAYMSAIEYFSKDGNEKQAMELHHVLIEKHLRVHIPFEMVKVLSSNNSGKEKSDGVS